MDSQENFYQKMNEVFQEREAICEKREQELKEYREELRKIETDLRREKEEIEKEKANLTSEKEAVEKQRAELKQNQESALKQQARILQEKLELQAIRNERMQLEHERERDLMQQSKEALIQPRQELDTPPAAPNERAKMSYILAEDRTAGAATSDVATDTEPEKTVLVLDPKNEMIPAEQEANKAVSALQEFADKAKAFFTEGTVLELTEDLFCLTVAGKELRIMNQNPMQAIILAKREKDRTLMSGISQLNRIQEEWIFSYQDKCLRSTMSFTKETSADVVLQKCAGAMTRYFL